MITIYGIYNHENDTKLTFLQTSDRAEITLEFTGEDPDFGTEILINGGNADETMMALCADQLSDITAYLDKTHDGLMRTVPGYPELEDLNNSSLIAFEHLLYSIVGDRREKRRKMREFVNKDGNRAMIAPIADVAKFIRDFFVADDNCEKYVDIADEADFGNTDCQNPEDWSMWHQIRRIALPFDNHPSEVALLMGYLGGGNVVMAYSYDDSDTQNFVGEIERMICRSTGEDKTAEVYVEFVGKDKKEE